MTLWKKSTVGAAGAHARGIDDGVCAAAPGRAGCSGFRVVLAVRASGVRARRTWAPSWMRASRPLHAGLRLNPDQEKTWPAFEQALRESARLRMERRAAEHNEPPAAGPVERLQRRADAMTTRGAAMKRVADAAAPLYQGLDDGQKRRFALLARFMGPARPPSRHGTGPARRPGRQCAARMSSASGPRRFGGDDGMRGPRGMQPGRRGLPRPALSVGLALPAPSFTTLHKRRRLAGGVRWTGP